MCFLLEWTVTSFYVHLTHFMPTIFFNTHWNHQKIWWNEKTSRMKWIKKQCALQLPCSHSFPFLGPSLFQDFAGMGNPRRDLSFCTYAKFSEKLTFLTLTFLPYVCVSGGKKCLFFRKFWLALLSWNTHFEIRPFALLPTNNNSDQRNGKLLKFCWRANAKKIVLNIVLNLFPDWKNGFRSYEACIIEIKY